MNDQFPFNESGLPCESGRAPVFVRLIAPIQLLGMAPGYASYFPVPVFVVSEMLTLQLRNDLVNIGASISGGPLHNSFYVFEIKADDIQEAISSLRHVLQKVLLLDWTRLDWFDHREGVFRLAHYGSAIKPRTADLFTVETARSLLLRHQQFIAEGERLVREGAFSAQPNGGAQ